MHSIRLCVCASALALPVLSQNLGITLTSGVSGYIEVPYSAATVPTTGITVEAWVTYDDTTLTTGFVWPTLVRANHAAQSECYFLRVDASNNLTKQLRFKAWLASSVQLSASWTFSSGQLKTWTHVAGTYDGTYARLFINGAQVAISPTTGSGPLRDTMGPLRIGKGDDAGVGTEVWNGSIDEVRLWPFARSAAEIAATMNQQLGSVSGRVLTYNLNGVAIDSSGGLHGTAMGTVNYTANPLTLTSFASPGAVAYGTPSTICSTSVDATVTSVAQVGNAAFGLVGYKGGASSPAVLLLGAKPQTPPIGILGVGILVDLATLLTVGTSTSGLGVAQVSLAVPNNPGLANATLSAQYVFADATCGSQGFTGSTGLNLAIWP